MSNSTKPMRVRAMTVAGGIALIGSTGAGMANSANAASTSSASSTLAKIKYCESGGNYQAVNSSSGASGAYQFLNSTWRGLSAAKGYSTAASAPASVQDAAALELYSQSGTSPWAASSSCWSKLTSAPTSTSTSTKTTSTTTTAATNTSTATKTASPAATKTVPAKVTKAAGAAPKKQASQHPTVSGVRLHAQPGKPHGPNHGAPAQGSPHALPHGKFHAPALPKPRAGGKHHEKMPISIPTKNMNAFPKAA